MTNIETLFLYIYVLSILINLRILFRLITALISTPPKRFILEGNEIIVVGLTLSYIITYFIKN